MRSIDEGVYIIGSSKSALLTNLASEIEGKSVSIYDFSEIAVAYDLDGIAADLAKINIYGSYVIDCTPRKFDRTVDKHLRHITPTNFIHPEWDDQEENQA